MNQRPDQLDIQIEQHRRWVRKQTNLARRKLGLPPRDYQKEGETP